MTGANRAARQTAVALLDADCVREPMDVFDGKSTLAASIVRQEVDPTTRRPTDEIAVHGSVED